MQTLLQHHGDNHQSAQYHVHVRKTVHTTTLLLYCLQSSMGTNTSHISFGYYKIIYQTSVFPQFIEYQVGPSINIILKGIGTTS